MCVPKYKGLLGKYMSLLRTEFRGTLIYPQETSSASKLVIPTV